MYNEDIIFFMTWRRGKGNTYSVVSKNTILLYVYINNYKSAKNGDVLKSHPPPHSHLTVLDISVVRRRVGWGV